MQQIFSQRLRAARKRSGMKAKEFAEMLGISAAYLSQLEKGKRENPSPDLIDKAAKILGMTHGQLISPAIAPPPQETRPRADEFLPPPPSGDKKARETKLPGVGTRKEIDFQALEERLIVIEGQLAEMMRLIKEMKP